MGGGGLLDFVANVVTFGAYGQSQAQKEASAAQKEAEMEARKIAASKKPQEESATLIGGKAQDTLGQLDLLIAPDNTKKGTQATLGKATSTVGLGFGG